MTDSEQIQRKMDAVAAQIKSKLGGDALTICAGKQATSLGEILKELHSYFYIQWLDGYRY